MEPEQILTLWCLSGPGSNGNEGLLHTPKGFKIGASPSDAINCHTQDTHFGRGYSQHILSPTK